MSIYLPGKNPVIEVLRADPKRVKHVYCSIDLNKSNNQELDRLLKDHRIKIFFVDRNKLDRLSSVQHQGVIAELLDRPILGLKDFLAQDRKEQEMIVVLDQITDPHNFGAIMRAVECFGATAILWSSIRSAGVTDVVVKSSAGASELIRLIQVKNLFSALEELKAAGYWLIATSLGEGAEAIQKFKFPKKSVLLLGSEGLGLKALSLKSADFTVYLPMAGRIDSLNVSQAAAVFLSYWRDQQ